MPCGSMGPGASSSHLGSPTFWRGGPRLLHGTRSEFSRGPCPRPRGSRGPSDARLRPSASVAAMPAFVEESHGLGGALPPRIEFDPVDRAIALHDYLAMRMAYDPTADWRMTVDKKDLDPRRVFAQRRGNSVAYADLVTALGTAAGLFVLTVDGSDSGGKPHSWNVFWLQGAWWSVDVALDRTSSGRLKRDHFLSGEAAFHRLGFDAESLWIRAAGGMRPLDANRRTSPQMPCSPEMGLTECTRAHALATRLRLHQDR